MLCSSDRNYKSLHQQPPPLVSPPQTLSQFWFSCSPPLFFLSVFALDFSFHPSVHSLPPFLWSLCLFLFPPQRFIHPSEHPVLSIPFIGMIVIVAVVWCWLSELASQRARYGRSLSLWVCACQSVHPNSIKASSGCKCYPKDELLLSIT